MNYRKFRRNVRAISPIISTLLLIAIAVVAALVTYAWVMGYIGFQTGNAGKSIQIQSLTDVAGTSITIYVQNTGAAGSTITFSSAYVNGTLWNSAATPTTIGSGQTSTIVLTPGAPAAPTVTGSVIVSGAQATIKITTTSGTYSQITQALP